MTVLLRLAATVLLLAVGAGCDARVEQASATTAGPPGTTAEDTTAENTPAAPSATAPPAETAGSAEPTDETTDETGAFEHTVRAYFVRDDGRRFLVAPVAREIAGKGVAAGAIRSLLTGPTPDERDLGLSSSIPDGTTLHGVNIADGIATVDLSGEFASGGGTASVTNRIAQVVFTVTQFPTVDAVQFWLDGEPVEVFSSEGLILDGPQTRDDTDHASPAILLESPLPFASVTSPLRLVGTANTFEATFQVRITDPAGRVVYDRFATATSGSGTRGTFDITARFSPSAPGTGEVTVYELSAEDGSEINVATIPVRMS